MSLCCADGQARQDLQTLLDQALARAEVAAAEQASGKTEVCG